MKIFLFGHTGMLGRYLNTYLRRDFEVKAIGRDRIDAAQVSHQGLWWVLTQSDLKIKQGDIIINAMGTIKPQIDALGIPNAIQVNSAFPHILQDFAMQAECQLIHITTDCVFSGFRLLNAPYVESDYHDAIDYYGRTKSLGEPVDAMNIRTSIIGEEVNQERSLVSWVLSQKGKKINGYTNHTWNGMTCLELAKCIKEIILTKSYWKGVRHIFSPDTLTKDLLLAMINEEYKLGISIVPCPGDAPCYRDLGTIHPLQKSLNVATLREQIWAMREFVLWK